MKVLILKIWKAVSEFFIDLYGWVMSVWIVLFRNIDKPAVMYGFRVWDLSRRYAVKRDENWPATNWQAGKQQGIFPVGDTKLIVCSRMELKYFQKARMINKNVNIKKMFKRASYYKTEMKYKLINKK